MDSRIRQIRVGARLYESREASGITQGEMGEIVGVTRQTIGNWENGKVDPPMTGIKKWAKATGRSLDWIAWGAIGASH